MEASCSIPSMMQVQGTTTSPAAAAAAAAPLNLITMWNAHLIGCLGLQEREELKEIINQMGLLSAQAQHLKGPVTSFDRMRIHKSHRLYLCTSSIPRNNTYLVDQPQEHPSPGGFDHHLSTTLRPSCGTMMRKELSGADHLTSARGKQPHLVIIKGMLKVGAKDLFIRRPDGSIHEMSLLCVLDFYVHHSCQRNGIGRYLFDHMLSQEGLLAYQMGYDRPSSKLLSLLSKYYGLSKHFPQANQFVVFDAYFDEKRMTKNGAIGRSNYNTGVLSSSSSLSIGLSTRSFRKFATRDGGK